MVQPTKTAAAKGERMIEIKVRFWTNDIAGTEGQVIPGHALSSCFVRMEANRTHGIKPRNPAPFHSLLDLPSVMEKVLIQHGITLHANRRMKKYFAAGHHSDTIT